MHIGIDAGSGKIVAIELTEKDVDDAARTDTLLDQITVLLLAGTAVVQVMQFMGGLPRLLGTGYDHVALLKLAPFGALLGLAAFNRLALTDRLAGTAPDTARRRMRVSVAIEMVLGVLVVITAGFLASHARGTHEQPVWPSRGDQIFRYPRCRSCAAK